MIRKIFLVIFLIFLLLVLILEWKLGYIKYGYETHCIKNEFSKSENVAYITEMSSQKDFRVCYDVYFTSLSNINYVMTFVQIKNGKIVFSKLYKINEDSSWGDECKTESRNLRDVLNREIE